MSAADGVLDDLIFPADIIYYAVQGQRLRRVQIAQTITGIEQRRQLARKTRRRYELGHVARPVSQWDRIVAFHEVTGGPLWGFLLQDPTDSSVTPTTGLLRPLSASGAGVGTTGQGYGVPTYRLVRRRTVGTYGNDVDVRKPASTIQVQRDLSPVAVGVSAGNVSIDYTTGNVTFVADSQANVNAVTPGATTDVTLASALSGLGIGDRLWLQGLGGADAGLLNNASHEITNISTNTYTLATNTSGATITASGTGRKYPQASEALTWSGTFYVPVRFESESLDWEMLKGDPDEAERLVEGPSITLLEVVIP